MTEKTPHNKSSEKPSPAKEAKRAQAMGKRAIVPGEADDFDLVDEDLDKELRADQDPLDDNDEETDDAEKGDEEEPVVIGRPTGTRTTDEVLADDAAEQARPLDERMTELEGDLDELREELAALAKNRGSTRMFSKKGGGKKVVDAESGISHRRDYNVVHGEYIAKLHKLSTLKLKADEELKDLWENKDLDDDKKAELRALALRKGMMFLDEDQTRLRTLTTEKLEGTLYGRFCKMLNRGGRVRRIAKHIMFGAGIATVGVGVGMITGGAAFGAAAGLGLTTGLRGFRAFAAADAGSGRQLAEHTHGQLFEKIKDMPEDIDKAMEASAKAVADMYNGVVEVRQKAVRRAIGMAALFTSLGGGIGYALQHAGAFDIRKAPGAGWMRNQFNEFTGKNIGGGELVPGAGAPNPETPKPGIAELEAVGPELNKFGLSIEDFRYNSNENPFYHDKQSTHGMGPALQHDPALDNGKPGWHDLTHNRWSNSPRQLSSVIHAMGLDNLPDDMQSANALAETFKIKPYEMMHYHERVMEILNDPSTKVETGVPIKYAYESEWGADPRFEQTGVVTPGSDFELAWDNYVNYGNGNGTKTVITFRDPNPPHGMKTIELREQCGGQRIKELPPPPPKPVYQPQQTYRTPVRTYTPTYNPPVETHTPPPPPPVAPPPVAPPPPVIPPVIPPIVTPPNPFDKPPWLDPQPPAPFQGRQPGVPTLNIPKIRPAEIIQSFFPDSGNSSQAPGASSRPSRPSAGPAVGGGGIINGRS